MKKKLSYIIIFTFIIFAIFSFQQIYATNQLKFKEIEYTEEYKKWLELSNEEKQKVLMPRMYDIPKTNDISVKERNLKASTLKSFSLKNIIPGNTKIKNQYATNCCWAFSSLAALETNLALQDYHNGVKEKIYDFSERHLEYSLTREFKNGQINKMGLNRKIDSGGNTILASAYLTNGSGAISEKDMPFENNTQKIELSKIQNKKVVTKLYDFVQFPSYKSTEDTTQIKQKMKEHIQTKGGITAGVFGGWYTNYYNDKTGAIYCDDKAKCPENHEVLIIGWDDNYKIENFSTSHRPKKPGAWIVKNSWGTDNGDKGFYYISYEDVNIYNNLNGIEKASTTIDHNNIYQYNELGYDLVAGVYTSKVYMANEFKKKTNGTEYITEVALYVPETYTCRVYVNVNGTGKTKKDLTLVKLKAGSSETFDAGYHTLEFEKPVQIMSDNFVVVVEIQGKRPNTVTYCLEGKHQSAPMFNYVTTQNKKCFILDSIPTTNSEWYDISELYNADSTIKVFTKNAKQTVIPITKVTLNKTSLTLEKGATYSLTATVAPTNTTQSKTITWTSSNTNVASVDKNGKITAKAVGSAVVTAKTSNGKTATCKVTVTKPVFSVNYSTHVQNIGWQNYVKNGAMSGTSGKSLRLEGIKIKLSNSEYSGGIRYSTHVQNIGWQGWKQNDTMSGTSGRSLRLEAIKIELTGDVAKYYDIYYRVHCENIGWLDWAKNGEEAGSAGFSYRLEGIEIKLVKKGGAAPGKTQKPFMKPLISYQTHVQNEGWQQEVKDKVASGTSGKSYRLEGIKIRLENQKYSGNIEYRTHVQNLGWEKKYAKNGSMSGTNGKSLRLEAIQIRLTGEMAKKYDIYYRVHAQNFGWMGWAKNGAEAGTAGYSYRLEAIEICLVEKGKAAPGTTKNSFRSK